MFPSDLAIRERLRPSGLPKRGVSTTSASKHAVAIPLLSPGAGQERYCARTNCRGLQAGLRRGLNVSVEEREVLRKAGLSGEADPENYLGGSSQTMYFLGLDIHE